VRIAVPVLCRSVKVSVNSRGPGAIAGGDRSLTLSGEFILHVAWPTTANDFDTSQFPLCRFWNSDLAPNWRGGGETRPNPLGGSILFFAFRP